MDEVVGGVLRRHSRVHEADQIRECVIAEDQVHLRVRALVAIDAVEGLRQIRGQVAKAVSRKIYSQAAPKNAFVRSHPLHSELVGNRNSFFGNAAFRWPNSIRTNSKNRFVELDSASQLFASVFRMAIAILRQRQSPR